MVSLRSRFDEPFSAVDLLAPGHLIPALGDRLLNGARWPYDFLVKHGGDFIDDVNTSGPGGWTVPVCPSYLKGVSLERPQTTPLHQHSRLKLRMLLIDTTDWHGMVGGGDLVELAGVKRKIVHRRGAVDVLRSARQKLAAAK